MVVRRSQLARWFWATWLVIQLASASAVAQGVSGSGTEEVTKGNTALSRGDDAEAARLYRLAADQGKRRGTEHSRPLLRDGPGRAA